MRLMPFSNRRARACGAPSSQPWCQDRAAVAAPLARPGAPSAPSSPQFFKVGSTKVELPSFKICVSITNFCSVSLYLHTIMARTAKALAKACDP